MSTKGYRYRVCVDQSLCTVVPICRTEYVDAVDVTYDDKPDCTYQLPLRIIWLEMISVPDRPPTEPYGE